MDKIAEIGKELIIVFIDEVFPWELAVALLRAIYKQVVSPYFSWNVLLEFDCVGSEYSSSVSLWEFTAFIVQVLSCGDMVK